MAIALPSFEARRVRGHLEIGGQDILLGLASQHILSFTYTDNTSDKADDLAIELADPDRTWMKKYLPSDAKKGIECKASMTISDWKGPGDTKTFQCGTFYINHVGFKLFPNLVSLKASSVPPNGVKSEKKHKAWEGSDLPTVAGDIAQVRGLELFYDTQLGRDKMKRIEQKDKADLEFLRGLCKENNLSLKVHDNKLVIYSEKEYEARPPAFTLRYGMSQILGAEFSSDNDDTFASAEAAYVDPDTGRVTLEGFTPGDVPEGTKAKLKVNEAILVEPDDPGSALLYRGRIEGRATLFEDPWDNSTASNSGKGKATKTKAKGKAEAKLRDKNKKEKKCSFEVFGNIDYLSGLNFQTVDFGIFDLKWFIESSAHSIQSGGYTTKLSCRHTLTY